MTIKSVGIYGSSSGRNAGDAALVAGIMDALDGEFNGRLRYEVPTLRPAYIRNEYQNDAHPITMLPWHGALGMFGLQTFASFRRTDCAVIYDNMLFDKKLFHPYFNYMPAVWYLWTKMKRPGQITGMYNCGLGPVPTTRGRSMLREIAQACDFITVRDNDSANLLRELGIPEDRFLVTADAALNAPASGRGKELLKAAGIDPNREVLAFNINSYIGSWSEAANKSISRDEFTTLYARAVSEIHATVQLPLLFVATQHSDVEITEEVLRKLAPGISVGLVSNQWCNHADIRAVLGEVSFLFAMRLHANILATSMKTPAAALAFQKKVSSYYSELGLSEAVMTFDDLSVEKIKQHVLGLWERRGQLREKLAVRIPQLQQRALIAAQLIKKISDGASPQGAMADLRQYLKAA